MGRLKKFKTEQEKVEAQRNWSREYYYRNKVSINKKVMEKYYGLRKGIQPDNTEGKG